MKRREGYRGRLIQEGSSEPPKGSLKPSFELKDVTWTCVSVDVELNEFTYKSSDGQTKVKKWEELGSVKV
jgi:hypothetical protein